MDRGAHVAMGLVWAAKEGFLFGVGVELLAEWIAVALGPCLQ